MRIKNLTKIWVCSPSTTNVDGEYTTDWTFKKTEYMNIQQDLNELDRNSAGNIDYSILKGRTDRDLGINNGDGIYFNDISSSIPIPAPDYIVKNQPKIGKTTVYTLIKNNDVSVSEIPSA